MSAIYSENGPHRATLAAAEVTRQAAVSGGASQATVKAAEIAFQKTAAKSAISNGLSPSQFMTSLRELGQWGVY